MGTYFNPNNGSFQKTVKNEIYIDKTGLLEELNKVIGTESNCIALSHARRFGKSQAAGMIDAYYSLGSNSKELFSKFEIATKPDFEEHLNQYNVIHLDISSFTDYYKEDLVNKIIQALIDEFQETLGLEINTSKTISKILSDIYKKTGRQFVIILDEWDCVVRNHADKPELVHEYLQFLHSLFKSEESKSFLALAYITGILPVKKIRDESALNNFREFTMIRSKKLTRYFGFTEEEVRDLCIQYEMDFDSVRQWYDGYLIDGMHMYNPNSVYQAMVDQSLETYWKNTSAFETINTFISMNYEGLKDDVMTMLEGGKIRVNTNTFKNDLSQIGSKDDSLTALIHLGYLAYDYDRKKAFIPNYEVALAFQAALQDSTWKEVAEIIARCDELLDATIEGDTRLVAEIIDQAHETYVSNIEYNDENSLSCVLTMAYFTAPGYYNIVREMPAGKGFADLAFIPRANAGWRPALIVELKWDKSAETAIEQIKERRYAGALEGYTDTIVLAGISYDKKTKKHECVIEEIKL